MTDLPSRVAATPADCQRLKSEGRSPEVRSLGSQPGAKQVQSHKSETEAIEFPE